MEVVETAYAGHAKVLASTVDLNKCPDGNTSFIFFFLQISIMCHFVSLFNILLFTGILCVGGDGIVNEVSSVPMFLSLYELNQDTILLCCFWVIFFFAFSTYINHVCAGLFFFVALIKATILSSELPLTYKSFYLRPQFQIVGHFCKSRYIVFFCLKFIHPANDIFLCVNAGFEWFTG